MLIVWKMGMTEHLIEKKPQKQHLNLREINK